MKNVSRKKESYERPQMEIILLEAKNAVLTSCTGNEASPNGDSNEEPGCVSGYCPNVSTTNPCTLFDENCVLFDSETGCIACDQATDIL